MPPRVVRYGEITSTVIDWVRSQPPGTSFYYGDLADELEFQRPTVSAILTTNARQPDAIVARGPSSGWYIANPRPNGHAAKPGKPAPAMDSGELMVVVGKRKDGSLLLRAEDGSLWNATEE